MAVYTEVSDQELEEFLAGYELGAPLSCKGIAEGVENSNFMLSTERGTYFLTLYEKRVDPADLPFFLGLMEHLAARGIPCPTPIHARNGQALGKLAGRPAAIISFLSGMWHKKPTAVHCAALGQAAARMHEAAADFPLRRRNALSVQGWRPLLEASAPRAQEVQAGLTGELEKELAFLERNWPSALPQGVIHADLFNDNVLFLQDRISGLIDFYFACNDALAYDIAICLNAWCFEPDRSFNTTKARALLSSYQRERPFTAEEREAIPILARGSALRFLLTRLYDWLHTPPDALVRRKDPLEYLNKLRFHRTVRGIGAYGVE
ncbi:MAG: homoserine kinase [Reyranellaceae bacterium]